MVQPSVAIFATFIQLALFAQLSIGFPVQYVIPSPRKATLSEFSLLPLGLRPYSNREPSPVMKNIILINSERELIHRGWGRDPFFPRKAF